MSSFLEGIHLMEEPVDRVVELLWHDAMMHLEATNNEVILPYNVVELIGRGNVDKLVGRLSTLLGESCQSMKDNSIQAIRILVIRNAREMDFIQHAELSRAVHSAAFNGVKIPRANDKIPRPANSFILFRQKRHHAIKAANPGITNNEISKIVGKEWRNASEDVKAQFKALADELKRQHAIDHPDYQYAPRRPHERRRRRTTARVHTKNLPFLKQDEKDLEYLKRVTNDNDMVEVDEEFLNILGDRGMLEGAVGLAPILVPDNGAEFDAIVNEQLDGQEIETLVYDPLLSDQLDQEFDFSSFVTDFE